MSTVRPADHIYTMRIFRRTQAEPEPVDVFARLAAYEATSTDGLDGRYAAGYTHPASPLAGGPGHIAAPRDVPSERRGAVRYPLHLSVRAKSRGDEEWYDGQTVDASATGLCIDMACAPDEEYLDVELDSTTTVTAWARVVACTRTAEGRFRWGLRLVSYDEGYPALLEGLELVDTGLVASPGKLSPFEPGVDEDALVAVGSGQWGELLVRATA